MFYMYPFEDFEGYVNCAISLAVLVYHIINANSVLTVD
jgi:hypothetical protein